VQRRRFRRIRNNVHYTIRNSALNQSPKRNAEAGSVGGFQERRSIRTSRPQFPGRHEQRENSGMICPTTPTGSRKCKLNTCRAWKWNSMAFNVSWPIPPYNGTSQRQGQSATRAIFSGLPVVLAFQLSQLFALASISRQSPDRLPRSEGLSAPRPSFKSGSGALTARSISSRSPRLCGPIHLSLQDCTTGTSCRKQLLPTPVDSILRSFLIKLVTYLPVQH